jgi:phenylpyruvate tautomerase PptA (4-oxalocrotonate tautomerase family)
MTAVDLINFLTNGGPTVLLAVGIWAFLTGRIVPKSTYDAALVEKDRQIDEAQEREAEIWEILKGVTGLTVEAAGIAKRSTRVAEAQMQATNWAAAEARLDRPRRSRIPKAPPP